MPSESPVDLRLAVGLRKIGSGYARTPLGSFEGQKIFGSERCRLKDDRDKSP